MLDPNLSEAFIIGREAFMLETPLECNPFRSDTIEHEEFKKGWLWSEHEATRQDQLSDWH